MVTAGEREVRAPTGVVAVGASAGGVPALTSFVAELPPDLDVAILVVLHVPANGRSVLPQILERASGIPAAHPRDREPMIAGHIYVAPPDLHLVVHDGMLRVRRGSWENGYRPSIDALFRSVARWYGAHAIGVVLSGALDDGAAGLASISDAGGTCFVQDPAEATVPDMPDHALQTVPTADVLPVREIAKKVVEHSEAFPEAVPFQHPVDDPDIDAAEGRPTSLADETLQAAGLVCPDCGGSMFEIEREPVLRYRCRVGHGWTADALHGAHGRQLEQALWAAVRVLEENQAVQQRLASRAHGTGRTKVARRLEAQGEERERLVAVLRSAIEQFGSRIPIEFEDIEPSEALDDASEEVGT